MLKARAVFVYAAAVALCACDDAGAPAALTVPEEPAQATLSVVLTDAPFPYDSVARVELYVDRIEVSPNADTSAASTAWTLVAAPRRRFDLLTVQNGTTTLLGESAVPPGTVRAVRLVIDTDSSALIATGGAPMAVDWGAHAGRPVLYGRVESPIEVGAAGAAMVVDFDVGRSFLCVDPSCRPPLAFAPSFRAVNRAATGSVAGVVRGDTIGDGPLQANATVSVYRGDSANLDASNPVASTLVATGKTDELGRFVLAFVLPGTYLLRADAASAARYSTGYRTNVVVAAGQRTEGQDLRLPPGSRTVWRLRAVADSLFVGDSMGIQVVNPPPRGPAGEAPVVTWSSSADAVLRVGYRSESFAQAHAVSPGTATVTATYEGRSASLSLKVLPRPGYVALRINPTAQTISVGDSVMFQAWAVDGVGRPLYSEPTTWSLSDSAVAGFSVAHQGFGNLKGLAPGVTTVIVTLNDLVAKSEITVRPRPTEAELRILPTAQVASVGRDVFVEVLLADASGYHRPGSSVVWSVSDPTVLAFQQGIGIPSLARLRANAPGTATVTATIDGTTLRSTVTVLPGP